MLLLGPGGCGCGVRGGGGGRTGSRLKKLEILPEVRIKHECLANKQLLCELFLLTTMSNDFFKKSCVPANLEF